MEKNMKKQKKLFRNFAMLLAGGLAMTSCGFGGGGNSSHASPTSSSSPTDVSSEVNPSSTNPLQARTPIVASMPFMPLRRPPMAKPLSRMRSGLLPSGAKKAIRVTKATKAMPVPMALPRESGETVIGGLVTPILASKPLVQMVTMAPLAKMAILERMENPFLPALVRLRPTLVTKAIPILTLIPGISM